MKERAPFDVMGLIEEIKSMFPVSRDEAPNSYVAGNKQASTVGDESRIERPKDTFQIIRRATALKTAMSAFAADFSQFIPEQIVAIVRSQCLAAVSLIADDDHAIEQGLAIWSLAGEPEGGDRPFMQLLSNKSPHEALKILRRWDSIKTNRRNSRAVNLEKHLMVEQWVSPAGKPCLCLCSNDVVATIIASQLVKTQKSKSKLSELKSSLGLISHNPPIIKDV